MASLCKQQIDWTFLKVYVYVLESQISCCKVVIIQY